MNFEFSKSENLKKILNILNSYKFSYKKNN